MTTDDIIKICDRLMKARKILLIGHKNPDGDAVGSTSSLAVILEKAGKKVSVMYPNEVAKRLEFILCGRKYQTPQNRDGKFEPDLIVTLDSASSSRLGSLEAELSPKVDLSIDHHDVCTPFAKETYTDGDACATSELVYDIACELKNRGVISGLDSEICYPMYAGIASDSGNFKYANTTAHTFRVCSDIVTTGIDNAEISRLLFDTCSLERIKADAISAENLEIFAGGLAAIVTVSQEIFASTGLTNDDFDESVNLARKIRGVEIGAYIRPSSDEDGYKVSLRANSYADVSAIAALHGGGGHIRAAGFTIKADSMENAREILKKDVENALK